MNYAEKEVTDFIGKRRGVGEEFSLNPCLFNVFINDTKDYINEDN